MDEAGGAEGAGGAAAGGEGTVAGEVEGAATVVVGEGAKG